jgi:lysophospholipase L1-like esterase
MASRPRLPVPAGFVQLAALCVFLLAMVGCDTSSIPARARATPSPTPRSSVVYVALGASDAMGVGASDPARNGYVPDLIARLPAGTHALNLGISGIQLHDALADELPQAVADQPTLMTIWLVANDFKACVPLDQYHSDLEKLLATLQTQTHAAIFIANLPDMSALPAIQSQSVGLGQCLLGQNADAIRAMVVHWNTVIAEEAQRHHVVLVDLSQFNLAAHPEFISDDGFHPSTAGYLALANLFWAEITSHHAVP